MSKNGGIISTGGNMFTYMSIIAIIALTMTVLALIQEKSRR